MFGTTLSADLAFVAVQHSHDNGFAGHAASVSALSSESLAPVTMHVFDLSADESFIYFYAAGFRSTDFEPKVAWFLSDRTAGDGA